MKISKLKAMTIATSVIGAASLTSIIGLTTVAVLDSKQDSENQNYSQNGNNDDGQPNGSPKKPGDSPVIVEKPTNNPDQSGNTGQIDSVPKKPENNSSNNNVSAVSEADVKKLFINKRTIKSNEKVFEALDQIKSINDIWKFYSKPANVPNNFNISLSNVVVTSQTPDSGLGLEATVIINDKVSKKFVIYGFSSYTSEEYKTIFEAANSSAKFMKNGKYFPYVDWLDLSKDPKNKNYFANYFKPVIPRELSANNIIVTPKWFSLLPQNMVNYNYVLHSLNNIISVEASVPVSRYYDYPDKTNGYKDIDKSWKPGNFDFIKANLPSNYSRADFDSFISKHWNSSMLVDALNAVRYWYLFDKDNMTWKLQQFIFDAFWSTDRYNWTIGYLIGAKFSKGDGAGPHYIWGDANRVDISPTYDSTVQVNWDQSTLNLNWHLPKFVEGNFFDWFNVYYGYSSPFNIDASLKIVFNTKDPNEYLKNKGINAKGLLEIPVTVKTYVNNPNKSANKYASITKQENWTILDALYYYFKNNHTLDKSYTTPFFMNFWSTLKKKV